MAVFLKKKSKSSETAMVVNTSRKIKQSRTTGWKQGEGDAGKPLTWRKDIKKAEHRLLSLGSQIAGAWPLLLWLLSEINPVLEAHLGSSGARLVFICLQHSFVGIGLVSGRGVGRRVGEGAGGALLVWRWKPEAEHIP